MDEHVFPPLVRGAPLSHDLNAGDLRARPVACANMLGDMDAFYAEDAEYSLMIDCQSLSAMYPASVNIEATATATDVSLASAGFACSPSEIGDPQQRQRPHEGHGGGAQELPAPQAAAPTRTRERNKSLSSKFVLEGFEIPHDNVQRQKRVVRRFVSEEERRLRRRATNREAARRTRQRKQHLITQMENEISKLDCENDLLADKVSALTSENVGLLAHMSHMSKDCQQVNRDNAALMAEYQHLRGIVGVSPPCLDGGGGHEDSQGRAGDLAGAAACSSGF